MDPDVYLWRVFSFFFVIHYRDWKIRAGISQVFLTDVLFYTNNKNENSLYIHAMQMQSQLLH